VPPPEQSSAYGLYPAGRESPSLIAALRRRFLIVVLTTLAAGGAAAAFAYSNRDTYESTAKLLFRQTISPADESLEILPATIDADNQAASNAELIGSRRVAEAAATALRGAGTQTTGEDVAEDVTVTAVKDADVVQVVAQADSAAGAARLANAYAGAGAELAQRDLTEHARRLLRNVDAQLAALSASEVASGQGATLRRTSQRLRALSEVGISNPTIIQDGSIPSSVSGDPVRTILLGVLFGVVLGVGLALLREQADRRLHRPEEVAAAFEAPVLSTVPRSRALKRNVRFGNLPSEVAEAFRMLQVNLRYGRSEPVRSLMVTSARSGEGKSTIAWNLASAAVTSGLSVALVEADLRKPSMAERYDLEPEPGLTEALRGEITIAEAMQPVLPLEQIESLNGHQRRLQVLVACGASTDPWALIQSDAMSRLLEVLKSHHDLVVVDTPPIPHVADAISLLRHVDGVIVAASVNSTKGPDAWRLRDQLQGLDARVLGVVANGGTTVSGYGYAPVAKPAAVQGATGNGPGDGRGAAQQPAEPR
jgi:succinoglycan biosynthesis transport protein ExoP